MRYYDETVIMKHLSKNLIITVLALFLITFAFSSLLDIQPNKPETISLNALAEKINSGAVSKITVNGEDLEIELSDGTKSMSRKESETSVSQTLANYGVLPDKLLKVELDVKSPGGFGYWMGVLLPAIIPVIFMLLIFWFIFRQAKVGANQALAFGRANFRIFSHKKDKITFKDVAGLKESKEELEEVVDFLKNPKKFLDIGAKIPRGVLLMGSPGTGKTLLARAVAGEGNVPFFHLSASEFVEMFVGVGASRVRDLFETAKRAAPSIIFIDEIDAVGRERGTGLGGGHDEREQTLNQILVEMDGFDRNTNVIVMAATNRPDVLDPALLRPGRFDRRVVLDMPDMKDREEILKIHSKNKPLSQVDLKSIAVRTPGFSGADLANLANEAAILTARENRKKITQDDFFNSIEKVLLGPARRSRVISEQEKKITAYHEAGHALVAAGIKDSDPVHKVTIISRGMAGGYTLKLPIEDRRIRTKAEFLSDLAVFLGGYTAESQVFGDISTGSSSDLKQATEIANKIVTQYGMSEKLGPRTLGKNYEMVFLGREIASEKDYSEKTGELIDEEVSRFLKKAFDFAKKIILSHRPALDAIALKLIEQETIEQEEFNKIISSFKIKQIKVA
ncbi:MAG: ATP-dependent zinc metalloprotease FtsH [Candidatus Jorgensenbacteria bacterium GW2011_GWA2_45_9]|uniref:ATP-dependent zinc metalloprotease FtsH n=2 Tax=Candidatus Joergenseniibacteriota TaxID=1752739 RepID=A0A0G1N529_9BACT|nr:MAG: ATP-dependent zinc metalloprotease FtsH [Candidatus Jorgensenbacteria bacterium GW2011_GWA2_45_9]